MKKLVCKFLLLFWVVQVIGQSINYQGRLTDASGEPVNDTVNVSLKIYDSETGGSVRYSEEVGEVEVVNGLYSFNFGSGNSIIEKRIQLAKTTKKQLVYNFFLEELPVENSVSLKSGEHEWSSVNGSNDNSKYIGSISYPDRNVTFVYTNPDYIVEDEILFVEYEYESKDILSLLTLGNRQSFFLEVYINGNKMERERLLFAPFAVSSTYSDYLKPRSFTPAFGGFDSLNGNLECVSGGIGGALGGGIVRTVQDSVMIPESLETPSLEFDAKVTLGAVYDTKETVVIASVAIFLERRSRVGSNQTELVSTLLNHEFLRDGGVHDRYFRVAFPEDLNFEEFE